MRAKTDSACVFNVHPVLGAEALCVRVHGPRRHARVVDGFTPGGTSTARAIGKSEPIRLCWIRCGAEPGSGSSW